MKQKQGAPAGGEPAEDANQSGQANTTTAQFGPVEKIRWLACASALRKLSRVELALLTVLADMINSATGQAWPSYATLAARTGSTVRHAKRAVKNLAINDLVVIVEHGNRVRSNRYTLNREYFSALLGSDPQTTTVVAPVSSCGGVEVPDVVTHRPPESIHESEHKANDEMDGSQADGGAAPFRPVGASGAPRQDGYGEFWDAMGRRTSVADAEQLIREAMAEGVQYQDIVDGAYRYREYCIDTGNPPRLPADKWLQKQKWLDDWKLIKSQPKAKGVTKSASKTSKGKGTVAKTATGKPRRKKNPDYAKWERLRDRLAQEEVDLRNHCRGDFIPEPVKAAFDDLGRRHDEMAKSEPPRWIEVEE
jgi:hypothetical protein